MNRRGTLSQTPDERICYLMQITLEKVEILKKKSGLGYRESLELLERTEGDLIKALAMLEGEEQLSSAIGEHEEKLWQKALRKGKEAKIKVSRTGGTLFHVPLLLGLVGAVAFPRTASLSMLALLLTRCTLEVDFHR